MVTRVSELSAARRIVIKTGSALMADNGAPRVAWLKELSADIATLLARGQEVVLVSSGAVALGRNDLGIETLSQLEQKQAAAAIGQPRLMAALAEAFGAHDIVVGQALLTLSDTEGRRSWLNARATLATLLDAGVVPVINENDTVATDEIRYGDNDRLAARVAQMIGADVLILLSDIDGLYTEDPRANPDATHIPLLTELTDAHDDMAGEANAEGGVGTGGMVTKLAAARIAWAAGCSTYITRGDRARPIQAIEEGALATLVKAGMTPARARETWLQGHLKPEGVLHIDRGAAAALAEGASLLPVGIFEVDGVFERGAAVAVLGPEGKLVAKGVTAYASSDIARVLGRRSDEVEAILGQRGRPAIIHRDDMVAM